MGLRLIHASDATWHFILVDWGLPKQVAVQVCLVQIEVEEGDIPRRWLDSWGESLAQKTLILSLPWAKRVSTSGLGFIIPRNVSLP